MLTDMKRICDDCSNTVAISIVGYGAGYMAEILCPDCGISYDTNLDERESNA
jgi:hypothetical protein